MKTPVLRIVCVLFIMAMGINSYSADNHSDEGSKSQPHTDHSDDLLTLLGYKIKLQKLQSQFIKNGPDSANLNMQNNVIKHAMPILSVYMRTPKSYYLTTEMYHDSLENRAAMLADFSDILVKYQKQLVSIP